MKTNSNIAMRVRITNTNYPVKKQKNDRYYFNIVIMKENKEDKNPFKEIHDEFHNLQMIIIHETLFGKFLRFLIRITGKELKQKYRK